MNKCKYCGAMLDAGEICDCRKNAKAPEIVQQSELILEVVPFEPIKEIQFNKRELEERLKAYLTKYDGIVITEDMIPEMKKERSKLNKLTKAINDERIRQKKIFTEPITAFENDVKGLTALIESTVRNIDIQIKAYDEKEKTEKLEKLRTFFETRITNKLRENGVTFDRIFRKHWENKSESLKACQNDIDGIVFQILKELEVIAAQCTEFYLECENKYFENLRLVEALELEGILKRKKEACGKIKAEKEAKPECASPDSLKPKEEEKRFKVTFEAYETLENLNELKAIMDNKGWNYTVVK